MTNDEILRALYRLVTAEIFRIEHLVQDAYDEAYYRCPACSCRMRQYATYHEDDCPLKALSKHYDSEGKS